MITKYIFDLFTAEDNDLCSVFGCFLGASLGRIGSRLMAPCFEYATVCFIIGRRGPRRFSDDKIGVGFKLNRIG